MDAVGFLVSLVFRGCSILPFSAVKAGKPQVWWCIHTVRLDACVGTKQCLGCSRQNAKGGGGEVTHWLPFPKHAHLLTATIFVYSIP